MRIRSFRSVLDECIAALQQGDSVENCLARYPRHADRLRPLLTMAARISLTPAAAPRPVASAAAWNRVRTRAADLRAGGRRRLNVGMNTGAFAMWLRPLAAVMALVFMLAALGGGTAFAARDALPDSPLYRVKLATEDVRLWFVNDDVRRAEILLDQSDTRLQEMMAMVQNGKPIPSNVLDNLRDRHERAAEIASERPQEAQLRARVLSHADTQERLLIALWPDVSESARTSYTHTLATVHNTRLSGSAALVSIEPEELMGGVLNISGTAEPVGDGVWNVGGVEMRIDERTIGRSDLQAGAAGRFVVARGLDGSMTALTVSAIQTGAPPSGAVVSGLLEQIENGRILVAGQWFPVTPQTLVKLQLRPGERVEITLGTGEDGPVADSVRPSTPAYAREASSRLLTVEGTLEESVQDGGSSGWVVSGLEFTITPTTTMDARGGNVAQGARVQIQATSTGTDLLIRRITVLSSDAPEDSVYVIGAYQGTSEDGYWQISGLDVRAPEGAAEPAAGSIIAVDAVRQGGDLVGRRSYLAEAPSETNLIRFQGPVTSIEGNTWTMDIGQVRVTSVSEVSGQTVEGARALVWLRDARDGGLEVVFARFLDGQSVPATAGTPSAEE